MNNDLQGLSRRLSYLSREKKPVNRNPLPDPFIEDPDWVKIGEYTHIRHFTIESPLPRDNMGLRLMEKDGRREDLIFYDTETTGLSAGAGNLVFLIGLVRISGTQLEGEQVFLSDFPGEPEFLKYIADRLPTEALYVSYNGKAFDRHMLSSRFAMNGLRIDLPRQLDLLYMARRLWKSITGQCSLDVIERDILNIHRESDVEGWEIPDIYFEYLRSGNAGPLTQVLDHNKQDILTLVLLLKVIEDLLLQPDSDVPVDAGRLGEYLLHQRDDEGLRHLERAFASGDARAGRILGLHLKRHRIWAKALAIWETLADRGNLFALVELAKYYEHHAKVPQKAMGYVEQAAELSWIAQKDRQDLQRRISRLENKIQKTSK